MSDDVSYDFSELLRLAADLTGVPEVTNREVRLSLQQTAIESKKFWAADARKSFPGKIGRQYGPTIDYTIRKYGAFGQGVYEAEVGPDLARYGGLTGKGGLIPSLGILEEANGGVRGPGRLAIQRAERFAAQELQTRMDLAVSESLRKKGLR